ncbi:GrpE, mitochondrial [Dimargaris verticillata]|uniref:GrpE protein homolog, mitochondrial n=1 Tax=Dimargaris verticillata TaxID=2761393 RepID=A0A9W8B8Y0_9FUNG|nr:GrpE, mitochondrial [Dimargaris verticillata]
MFPRALYSVPQLAAGRTLAMTWAARAQRPTNAALIAASHKATRLYTTENQHDAKDQAQTASNAKPTEETKGENSAADTQAESAEVKLQKQLAEVKDHYLRCLADMENLRQRTKKEVEHTAMFAIGKFAKELLDTVDILGLALKSVPEAEHSNQANKTLGDLYRGVSMTQTELLKTLKRHGVEQFDPIDEEFDPNKHQAMYQVDLPDKKPGVVISVEKSGYMIHGRVMRPAQVGVTRLEN